MNSGSPSAFANAREEIQLWPAAVMAFYFTVHETMLSLALFIILIWTGATTYKFHQHIRKKLETLGSFHELKNEMSRDRKRESTSSRAETVRVFTKFSIQIWDRCKPSRPLFSFVTILAMAANISSFILLSGWIGWRIWSTTEPSLTAIGLLSLPLLMLASIGSARVWNS